MATDPNSDLVKEEYALRVCGLSKVYNIYEKPIDILYEKFGKRARHKEHWSLRDVTFDVRRGDVVGIIGPNGAGKSTLLKIIAGTLTPTHGHVELSGRVSAILELGTGFHPEYSGRQNIVTGGMCLGMSRDEIESKIPWIINFTELHDVIDQPFKTYSSGMAARLTFSTAIAIEPEILIIDEALAAGDAYFVAKSFRRIKQICESGATVLFVSHGTAQVAQLCQKAIWLEQGGVRMIGDAQDVAKRYDYEMHVRASEGAGQLVHVEIDDELLAVTPEFVKGEEHLADDTPAPGIAAEASDKPLMGAVEGDGASLCVEARPTSSTAEVYRRGPVTITGVRFRDADGGARRVFRTWEDMVVEVDYQCESELTPVETLGMAIGIERARDLVLVAQFNTVNFAGFETVDTDYPYKLRPGRRGRIGVKLPRLQMLEGDYFFSIGILPNVPNQSEFYEYHHRTYKISIIPAAFNSGAVFYPVVEWFHDPGTV